MGSFRLAVSTSHLHEDFKFTKKLLETVEKSLRHSCRSGLIRQGISLPQNRQSYSCRLLGLIVKSIFFTIHNNNFTCQYRAGVRPYTSFFNFAKSCVFNKQSLLPILCHHIYLLYGPPYPKVTGSICRVPSTALIYTS